ncbi:MAG: phenylalanine--tRNA ligase subunit beta [Flavobacteriales bacterium]|nr:phenylalanine--tRNA ligase subunit beta [Flavobacteriales bacterium]
MRISWNWLRQYIATDLTPQEAAAVLTSTGLETESVELYEPVKGMLDGVVVGLVLQCDKHPDADRLSVCLVDLGPGEPVQIVCGAPNVAAGQRVLVATVGTTLNLADGTSIVIKKSKIRGQESHGMICAEDELGIGKSHAGIIVLDASARVGQAAAEHLDLVSDHVLEIGLTPNRTDAMGHIGVARDLRAALVYRTGATMDLQWPSVEAWEQDEEGAAIRVEVKDVFACPRYAGVTLSHVKVGPSPAWLQERLKSIGLKPINNVVDVTNYVQHELAQPLHAFDAATLKDGRIVVRMADAGETITTLDGKVRTLDAKDLVIADGSRAMCIAGVFGGADSAVTEGTTSVFLESACFEPGTIRRTARRHGLNTDASFRFERGTDPEGVVYALKRAALLLKEVAGARIASPTTDIDHSTKHARLVKLAFADCDKLTGVHIGRDAIVQILELLDLRIHDRSAHGVEVAVPSYRVDVHRPADVIEEILRIHGYDEVPLPQHLLMPPVLHAALTAETLGAQLASHLVARGIREIMTPSLVNGTRCIASKVVAEAGIVRLKNPLSAELDVMRPTMLFGALSAMAHNINRQQRDLRFFERGRVYRNAENGTQETDVLAITITGDRFRERWRSTDRKTELADVKEEVEAMLHRLGLERDVKWEPAEHALLNEAHALLVNGRHAGMLGVVNGTVLKMHDVGQPVFSAEIDERVLLEACLRTPIGHQEVARFPAVRRDLSLSIDSEVRFERLRKLALDAERKLLRDVDLFDVYQGDKLEAGKKSYALSFMLQDPEKTLTDDQVEKAMGRIRKALETGAGAEVRS